MRVTQTRYSPHKRAQIRAFFAEGVDNLHLPWTVEAMPGRGGARRSQTVINCLDQSTVCANHVHLARREQGEDVIKMEAQSKEFSKADPDGEEDSTWLFRDPGPAEV